MNLSFWVQTQHVCMHVTQGKCNLSTFSPCLGRLFCLSCISVDVSQHCSLGTRPTKEVFLVLGLAGVWDTCRAIRPENTRSSGKSLCLVHRTLFWTSIYHIRVAFLNHERWAKAQQSGSECQQQSAEAAAKWAPESLQQYLTKILLLLWPLCPFGTTGHSRDRTLNSDFF